MKTAEPTRGGFAGPLFITGMWRSGSSLLHALLNKDPRVKLMYEADLALLRPVFWKPLAADWAARWEFWNGAVRRHGFDPVDLSGRACNFRQGFETVYREYARRKGGTIWGDKSPDLHDRMVLMAKTFPEARFIVVWRNPAAVSASMAAAAAKDASFFRKPGMALRGLLGGAVLRRQCNQLLSAGIPLCEVDYEELVQEPAAVMRRVCEFLGIPYDSSLTTLEGANREAIHTGEHHQLLRGTQIVARTGPAALEAALAAKIERYVRWWQRAHQNAWPRHPAPTPEAGAAPGLVERIRDRILYRAWRSVDAFTRLAFCVAPLAWLRWYRGRKGKVASDS